MAKNKNRRRETSSPVATVVEKIPLVSVIIPMYNAEKFIPQTLESLLYQTMQDFEVIVIDDCSTDNSIEVVEGFSEKFGGRLHVIKLPENSGTPGLPRNVGIQFARGKYIAFLDSDDLFTKTALEELSTLAEKYQADVVHNDEAFCFEHETFANVDTQTLMNSLDSPSITRRNYSTSQFNQATAEPVDLANRIQLWVNHGFHWATWSVFCRRDFLVVNQINFPSMLNNEDMILFFRSLCLAKTFLRVPNCTYLYRQRQDSVSKKMFVNATDHFHKWLCVMRDGFNNFEEVMSKINFFDEHLDYRYAVKEFFFNEISQQFLGIYMQKPPFILNSFVQEEFHSDDAAFSAYLFNTVNIQRLQLMQLQAELRKFQQQ